MKNLIIFEMALAILVSSGCSNNEAARPGADTLVARYSGITELYFGLEDYLKIDSLTAEGLEGIKYLNIDTIIISNDTLRWSGIRQELEPYEKGYNLYYIKKSEHTVFGNFIGFCNKDTFLSQPAEEDITLTEQMKGFSATFYYLKKSYHQQYFSNYSLEMLRKDYSNTIEDNSDTLKYWTINVVYE